MVPARTKRTLTEQEWMSYTGEADKVPQLREETKEWIKLINGDHAKVDEAAFWNIVRKDKGKSYFDASYR